MVIVGDADCGETCPLNVFSKNEVLEEDIPITFENKTLGKARDPRANGAWLNKLTE